MKCDINTKPIKCGVYKHFKGKLYEVIGEAFHTEELRYYVVYKPLYESEQSMYVRLKDMFLEEVAPGVPRFKFVREKYE